MFIINGVLKLLLFFGKILCLVIGLERLPGNFFIDCLTYFLCGCVSNVTQSTFFVCLYLVFFTNKELGLSQSLEIFAQTIYKEVKTVFHGVYNLYGCVWRVGESAIICTQSLFAAAYRGIAVKCGLAGGRSIQLLYQTVQFVVVFLYLAYKSEGVKRGVLLVGVSQGFVSISEGPWPDLFEANLVNLVLLDGGLFYLVSRALSEGLSKRSAKISRLLLRLQHSTRGAKKKATDNIRSLVEFQFEDKEMQRITQIWAAALTTNLLLFGKRKISRLRSITIDEVSKLTSRLRKQVLDSVATKIYGFVTNYILIQTYIGELAKASGKEFDVSIDADQASCLISRARYSFMSPGE
jgi:hypothetical protein